MEYLFKSWDRVEKKIGRNNLFIFLDFDGTLAPIALTPKKAVLPKEVKQLLERMSENPRVRLAFISGRRLEDLKSKVGIKNAIYSGNHGLELSGPKIKFKPALPVRYQMIIGRIKRELDRKTFCIRGVLVEDKGLTLSLHYRLVKSRDIAGLKKIFQETAAPYLVNSKIKVQPGKRVIEVRPPVEWDKGRVVLWLLEKNFFASKNAGVMPIYIGDDVIDEDAFRVIKNKGLAIFVGKPKKSYARYYLKDHNEVRNFLERILVRYHGRISEGKRAV
ncbi:MAG: trehalose-phosphatase [Candidatus Omnitrophica bacterium]|nr:trehalose-phosphatase [Candidatus Omnitrophota bacterium]